MIYSVHRNQRFLVQVISNYFVSIFKIKMDFIDKKEKIADLIEEYISNDENNGAELIAYCIAMSIDDDFKEKELFQSLLPELIKYLPQLSRKELKQRVSIIRTFME